MGPTPHTHGGTTKTSDILAEDLAILDQGIVKFGVIMTMVVECKRCRLCWVSGFKGLKKSSNFREPGLQCQVNGVDRSLYGQLGPRTAALNRR